MYLIGAPHPHKADAQTRLEQLVVAGERLVTDVEVLQEILHRYVAIQRRDAIQPAYDAILGIVEEVFPIEQDDVMRAREIVLGVSSLSARDAIHVAVMESRGIEAILSFDRGFDDFPGLNRIF